MQVLPQEPGPLFHICFDPEAKRIAYHIRSGGPGTVVIRNIETNGDGDDGEQRIQCNGIGSLSFSPDGRLLVCGGNTLQPGKQFTVISLEGGGFKEVLPTLRYIALPPGEVCGVSAQFAPFSAASSLTLCVAVGYQCILVDFNAAAQAVEDNAWSTRQLDADKRRVSVRHPNVCVCVCVCV